MLKASKVTQMGVRSINDCVLSFLFFFFLIALLNTRNMFVTITTDGEDIYNLEIDSQMAIEDLKALLEAEVTFFFLFIHIMTHTYTSQEFHLICSVYFIMEKNYQNLKRH